MTNDENSAVRLSDAALWSDETREALRAVWSGVPASAAIGAPAESQRKRIAAVLELATRGGYIDPLKPGETAADGVERIFQSLVSVLQIARLNLKLDAERGGYSANVAETF